MVLIPIERIVMTKAVWIYDEQYLLIPIHQWKTTCLLIV
jgi:hypothetical protein